MFLQFSTCGFRVHPKKGSYEVAVFFQCWLYVSQLHENSSSRRVTVLFIHTKLAQGTKMHLHKHLHGKTTPALFDEHRFGVSLA